MARETTAFEIVWRNPWVRAVLYVVGLVTLVWALRALYPGYAFALQVALIGFAIAYTLNPVVVLFQRIRIARPLAVVIVYLVLLQIIALGAALLTQIIGQIGRFIELIPDVVSSITPFAENAVRWIDDLPLFVLERFGGEAPQPGSGQTIAETAVEIAQQAVGDGLNAAAVGLRDILQTLLSEGGTFIYTGVLNIISTTVQVVLILLASAYFLYDFPRFVANFRRFVPIRYRPLYADFSHKLDRAVGGYLRGQILLTSILGFCIWLGLRVIGVPLAESIAFIAAVFNLIPYLGPIIGTIPAVLLGFTVSPWVALGALIVFIFANQLEAHILGPIVLSKSTDLHPITVMLSILVGAGILGLLGALLAVPVAALAKVMLEEYLLSRPAYHLTGEVSAATAPRPRPPEVAPVVDPPPMPPPAPRTKPGV